MVISEIKRALVVLAGAFLAAIALNFFLIEANIYSSGFTGAAQMISSIFSDFLSIEIGVGIILFVLNIPVAILAWLKLGRSFTIYSIISIILMTLFLETVPIIRLADDILLNAVFDGVISGAGIGITLKWGASTGGMDIIALILSKAKDRPIGVYFLILNGLIILLAGLIYDPEKALYTLVTLYVTTRVIDGIHTRHQKLTAMIITSKGKELAEAIHSKLVRGITNVPAKGVFTNESRDMLVIVITRYELFDLKKIVQEVDEKAFTNIVQTTDVVGFFRKEDEKV